MATLVQVCFRHFERLGVFAYPGMNPKHLGAEIGMTMVLHTNTRTLDYHPQIHAVVPDGGIDRRRRYWKRSKEDCLFNGIALARVFRARFLKEMKEAGPVTTQKVRRKWVAHCVNVGRGTEDLTHLQLYIYRRVICEKNIV